MLRSKSPPNSKTILVAEPEDSVRKMICNALRSRGYKLIHADNGLQALRTAAAQASEVHLLVTDVVLPGLYGWELAELMRLDWPRLKVLFISSRLTKEILDLAQSKFVLLTKPFDGGVFSRCVCAALRRPFMKTSLLQQCT